MKLFSGLSSLFIVLYNLQETNTTPTDVMQRQNNVCQPPPWHQCTFVAANISLELADEFILIVGRFNLILSPCEISALYIYIICIDR